MKVIYADFNDFDEHNHLPLTCDGAVKSISQLAQPLREGEEVWLTDGDLRVRAKVRMIGQGTWEAYGDWQFESAANA